jgi:hypothetical protein
LPNALAAGFAPAPLAAVAGAALGSLVSAVVVGFADMAAAAGAVFAVGVAGAAR